MDRYLTLVLVKCWMSWWNACRLAGHRVLFNVFDVGLMTGLPALEIRVESDGLEVSIEMGRLVRQHMYE